MRKVSFSKGHGTLNDFVVVEDRTNLMDLDADDVRFLCDRRAGIGADGVLRVTRARHIEGWDDDPELWFMDYRNADGSIAEMCGNGLRVFGHYLYDAGLVGREPVWVGTRAGRRRIEPTPDGYRVTMGRVQVGPLDAVTVRVAGRDFPATAVNVGNPHAVVLLGPADELAALDLTQPPSWTPAETFPDGVNVEFVTVVSDTHLRMRVFERGSGETMSCGTGTVAAAAAHLAHRASGAPLPGGAVASDQAPVTIRVDVPGGRVDVGLAGEQATLTGPAQIVATGHVHLP